MEAVPRDFTVRREVVKQRKAVDAICRRRGFSYPTLFGSTARGDRSPGSDVDILVWSLGHNRGASDRRDALVDDLSALLHHPVDIAVGEWTHPTLSHRALLMGTVLFRRSGPLLRFRRWRYGRDPRRADLPVGRILAGEDENEQLLH